MPHATARCSLDETAQLYDLADYRRSDVEKIAQSQLLSGAERAPECKKGQFVGIFNDLARIWGAWTDAEISDEANHSF